MKQAKTIAAASVTKATTTHGFRVIVRGTNSDGKRIRRVFTAWAADEGEAMQQAEKNTELLKGLTDLYCTVLPPLV